MTALAGLHHFSESSPRSPQKHSSSARSVTRVPHRLHVVPAPMPSKPQPPKHMKRNRTVVIDVIETIREPVGRHIATHARAPTLPRHDVPHVAERRRIHRGPFPGDALGPLLLV